ncbi:MAG: hypothetical protein MJ060_01905 [Clostridia bacterium]|nr:hypothetical protein [Clostridia bacterium]
MEEKLSQINHNMIPNKIIYSSEQEVEAQIEQIKVMCEHLLGPSDNWNKKILDNFNSLMCEAKIAQPVYDRVKEEDLEWWQKY